MEVSDMDLRLPYYMMYPSQDLFGEERLDRRDYEYVRSMYPDLAKIMIPYVEEECDRFEYEESMMYDEYPDKLQLRLMSRRIQEQVRKQEQGKWDDDRIRDLAEVLLYQEVLRRRADRRRRQKRIIW